MNLFQRFCSDRSGATAIEYAFIAGAMALALVATAPQIGTAVSGMLTSLAAYL
jgi:Flp pilus assembly pilin Flp